MTSSALAEREQTHLRRSVVNQRLYVARVDFARVRAGEKRVWRSYRLHGKWLEGWVPVPVVIGSHHPTAGRIDTCLAVLTETWIEPLGAITEEGVEEEGFASRAEFKRYFAERYPKVGYRPLQNVRVFRVRPLTDDDREEWIEAAWNRCYGSFA